MDPRQIRTNVRNYRLILRMSPKAMGERLGISARQYRNLENGTTPISFERLGHIAAVFNIDMSTLVSSSFSNSFLKRD